MVPLLVIFSNVLNFTEFRFSKQFGEFFFNIFGDFLALFVFFALIKL